MVTIKQLAKEHRKIVKILSHPSKKKIKKLLKEQKKELQEYERKLKK